MISLSARQAAQRLAGATPPVLLDVREPWEVALAGLPGAIAIPLGQLQARCGELDPTRPTIVVCHHGVRSLHACMFLGAQGFTDLANLSGGSEAWSLDVDPTVARY
ncbi:MAG: sulfurtransferase [Cyanobacteria bacterium RYN_339]|nr:sulfurtransferase [Cyanobacteria bacterium RYN_339]